jgi:hypothetical protein
MQRTILLILLAFIAVISGVLFTRTAPLPEVSEAPTRLTTVKTNPNQEVSEKPIKNRIKSVSNQKETVSMVPVVSRDSHTFLAQKDGTVLEAMVLEDASGFTFTTKNYPALGVFVESINGKENRDGKYWILYLNGATSTLGASSARVSPGDRVEWRYEDSY